MLPPPVSFPRSAVPRPHFVKADSSPVSHNSQFPALPRAQVRRLDLVGSVPSFPPRSPHFFAPVPLLVSFPPPFPYVYSMPADRRKTIKIGVARKMGNEALVPNSEVCASSSASRFLILAAIQHFFSPLRVAAPSRFLPASHLPERASAFFYATFSHTSAPRNNDSRVQGIASRGGPTPPIPISSSHTNATV